ncbi:MAG TPA: hypothetical protein VMT51_16175 [Dongiaceae bacterium]|nr:hypothetical protein [Dongiaceae bacterium]
MRATRLFPFAALAALSLLAYPALAQDQSQSTGDPVADAARRAREQQKNAPKPKKVFTNDDVSSKPAPAPTPAPGEANATTPAGDTAAASNDSGKSGGDKDLKQEKKDEKYWRARFAEQRQKISDTQNEINVLQREIEKANLQYYPDPQKAMTEQFDRKEINDKTNKLNEKKQHLAELQQGLSNLEDELRQSGGDPGWAR